jgi:thiol-disulfide isomerase/thioredoxin
MNEIYRLPTRLYFLLSILTISCHPANAQDAVAMYDAKFTKLDELMSQAIQMLDTLGPHQVDKYVKENFDNEILSNISDSKYLSSTAYKNLLGFSYSYLFYLVKYDEKLNPGQERDKYGIYLDKILDVFNDEVRDYVLCQFIELNLVQAVNSYEKFHQRSLITLPVLSEINNKESYHKLIEKIREKETALGNLKSGDPAPFFSLPDSLGRSSALQDFIGKILVIDFWASWCGPCREETPFLQRLSEKFKNDKRLTFISIAVRDKKEAWLKALKKDKPTWLQLFDNEGKTADAYFTNAIPKFVIIDQRGMIFDFQAPEPSDGNKLESLIEVKLKAL